MSIGNGATRQFSVHLSHIQRDVLHEFHQRRNSIGKGPAFVAAFREIMRRLQHDPAVFGEHLYTLPVLKLEIRQAAVSPLVVTYGVHEERLIVFIQGFKLLG